MVNVGRANPLTQGEFYSRENWNRSQTQYSDIQDARFSNPPIHGFSQGLLYNSVETALKEHAGIKVKDFALIVIDELGEEKIYSSAALKPHWPKIFNERFKRDFRQCAGWATGEGSYSNPAAYNQEGMYELEFDRGHDYRKHSTSGESSSELPRRYRPRQPRSDDSSDDLSSGKRKRTHYLPDEDTPMPPVQKYQYLKIGDEEEVTKFYNLRFRDMQQSACKVMGKAFVKLVEPKKQTHYPYTKGDPKAPPWWPSTGDQSVRHKEPDHLLKPERIRLLVHILRMIVEPRHKQCSTVQKLELDVRKLEEVTMEAMSNWFNDKEHSGNEEKRPFLKEIFKVAKQEERYRNGELDAGTSIPVRYGDRPGGDDSDGDEEGLKEEDNEQDNPTLSTNMSTPEGLVSPSMLQGPPHNSRFEAEAQTMIQQNRPLTLATRHPQSSHMEDQAGYMDPNYSRPISSYHPQSPIHQNHHDFRRPPFVTPSFPSPQQQTIFPGNWQIGNPNYCGVASSPQATLGIQLPAPQHSSMLPPMAHSNHYADGLPSTRHYDSGPVLGTLRTGSLGHPHAMQHQGHTFGEFLQDGGSFDSNDSDLKQEQHIRPS
ncbi:Uncharacterized protein LSUE1_G001420 [Lachnellula suecica]|uniref:Subtelomeric hrmA-associated cluster protein AFUB-079030/YDR124W-like helical bundle domain-containing protein n=1 Tax=Lachnellula suecica TaxID=602035 RepID=A0A8T9CAK3_9HELO|nr:Uncharacterized protein LSUE1_G001420 [Lachnellula suecica]